MVLPAALVALSACSPQVASSASKADQRPRLVVADDNLVVVEGRGFVAQEQVTLETSIAGQSYKHTVKADREGRFTKQIAEVDAACLPFTVSAAGQRGSRAVTPKRIPPPCGVPIQP
jgi:hypothetical protein